MLLVLAATNDYSLIKIMAIINDLHANANETIKSDATLCLLVTEGISSFYTSNVTVSLFMTGWLPH